MKNLHRTAFLHHFYHQGAGPKPRYHCADSYTLTRLSLPQCCGDEIYWKASKADL